MNVQDKVKDAIAAVDPDKMQRARGTFDELMSSPIVRCGKCGELLPKAEEDTVTVDGHTVPLSRLEPWVQSRIKQMVKREVECTHVCYCCPRTYTHNPTFEINDSICELTDYICGGCLLQGSQGVDPRWQR